MNDEKEIGEERFVELEFGCIPEAAVSGPVLVQTDRNVFLTFNARRLPQRNRPQEGPLAYDATIAVVEFERCAVTKFGYPNDEAWSAIPRTRDLSYGLFEIHHSRWIRKLTTLNRHAFPKTPDNTDSRHFLFLFHDSSFECIAAGMKLELVGGPYANVFARISQRVMAD